MFIFGCSTCIVASVLGRVLVDVLTIAQCYSERQEEGSRRGWTFVSREKGGVTETQYYPILSNKILLGFAGKKCNGEAPQ